MSSRVQHVLERSYAQIRHVQAERERLLERNDDVGPASDEDSRTQVTARLQQLALQRKILRSTIRALETSSGR